MEYANARVGGSTKRYDDRVLVNWINKTIYLQIIGKRLRYKMAISEFELIVLENGDVGLQRVGSDEMLVRVKFSADVKQYLGDHHIEVAKRMIDTGIKTVYELEQMVSDSDEIDSHTTIH